MIVKYIGEWLRRGVAQKNVQESLNNNTSRLKMMMKNECDYKRPVTRLIELCDAVVPDQVVGNPHMITEELVEPIVAALKEVEKEELNIYEPVHWMEDTNVDGGSRGMTKGLLQFKPADIYYRHVAETERFSIGVFVLPPGFSIPLHDHPEMCVLSKVLYGQLGAFSCDWVDSDPQSLEYRRLHGGKAEIADGGTVYEAGATRTLFPNMANIHEFRALTGPNSVGCAILDVIIPPYDEYNGRDCTYYRIKGKTADSFGVGDVVDLVPVETPDSFHVENL